jgi:pyroglutamyl-peptidase
LRFRRWDTGKPRPIGLIQGQTQQSLKSIMAATILVTGFAPFGGESVNPSWQAAQRLDGWATAGRVIAAREIPCAFGSAIAALERAIADLEPEAVIAVGQAGGRADFSVERVAVNLDDAEKPDNEGRQPVDAPVIAAGPAAYFSSLPVRSIVDALRQAGLPASISNTAGGFVCNHLFYGACHLRETRFPAMRAGFIHVPYAARTGRAPPRRADHGDRDDRHGIENRDRDDDRRRLVRPAPARPVRPGSPQDCPQKAAPAPPDAG